MSEKTANACLRICTDESDPEFIAVALDAKATRQFRKGELRSQRNPLSSKFEQSLCIYESSLPDTCELQEHIAHMLTFLESRPHALDSIRVRITAMDIFCMFSSESGQGSAELDANLLQRLAEQRIDLIISLYPPEKD